MVSLALRDQHANFVDGFLRREFSKLRAIDPLDLYRAMLAVAKVHQYAIAVDVAELDLEMFPETYAPGYTGWTVGQWPEYHDWPVHETLDEIIANGDLFWADRNTIVWNRPAAVRPTDVVLTDADEGLDPVELYIPLLPRLGYVA